MYEAFLTLITRISDLMWGPWTMIFIAFVSVYLTIRTRFFQVSSFVYIMRNTFGSMFDRSGDQSKERMTPFQATTTSLAGTVGMGNMAGVATALSIGGPGAIFWMWVLAFFGMITKAAEVTIGVHYRDVDENGQTHGGPMYYINKALGWKSLAVLFSIGVTINCFFSSSLLQAHTVGRAFNASYGISPYLVTGVMAIVTAMVAIGGVRRIGRFCEALVPFMTLMYLASGLVILVANASQLPSVFGEIIRFALAPAPAVGGFAGAAVLSAIQMGMARGMLSNEAGLGTAPMVHANAETPHPFRQGLWGAAEVFIDTTVVCTITAFIILSSGVLANGNTGIEMLLDSFATFYSPELANTFISIAILTFCLSTQIGFFVYFETALVSLFGENVFRYVKWVYFLPGVAFAGITNVDQLWALANISVAASALPNLVALLVLSGVFMTLMKDYLSGENRFATVSTDASRQYVRMVNQ
ncbi:MAG: sodium:alanine symporter family protein [Candidatus Marinimicrobia bacterium]|jgi:AGCS family alanine or glycine:cation symporter|nr:sodium:alanine symporter family protein [Candidatus Neomarinimicrobiota bacterium]MDP7122368.1 sodium:alanine symporter family protein [Candidatus Neomarinimicrobiota bacterium]MDP7482926.1 sodium:alanine symporter family protein [Candidatus Neomarinimicrobiota bacterium]MDP7528106.1 sodium:alanine symporter family protein [Candidatus Neomarinimicrobiota bacterium]MDP7716470.1 sodium:alanine symporter family protein [Candidatus Neomarinimicrobiota bacterium]|tara:strand:+ start:2894 stop:4306 length:1413 start_codon:yes stop_codon:yes gene_type:complete